MVLSQSNNKKPDRDSGSLPPVFLPSVLIYKLKVLRRISAPSEQPKPLARSSVNPQYGRRALYSACPLQLRQFNCKFNPATGREGSSDKTEAVTDGRTCPPSQREFWERLVLLTPKKFIQICCCVPSDKQLTVLYENGLNEGGVQVPNIKG